jgi:hypothetical protein
LFSGEWMGVHEGVHSWEEVSLGRRGVEGAEEGGLRERTSREIRWVGWKGKSEVFEEERREKRWTDREVVADPVGDLGEHVGWTRTDEDEMGPSSELSRNRFRVRLDELERRYDRNSPRYVESDRQSCSKSACQR